VQFVQLPAIHYVLMNRLGKTLYFAIRLTFWIEEVYFEFLFMVAPSPRPLLLVGVLNFTNMRRHLGDLFFAALTW
jgi:hypothetical protein